MVTHTSRSFCSTAGERKGFTVIASGVIPLLRAFDRQQRNYASSLRNYAQADRQKTPYARPPWVCLSIFHNRKTLQSLRETAGFRNGAYRDRTCDLLVANHSYVVSHPTFCRTLQGKRASVPFPSDIHAVLCREKLTLKLPPPAVSAAVFQNGNSYP